MPRDADIDPEAKVPSPSAEPAVESRPGGALVPADALQRYLSEIRRIPLLSREEEHELAVRWHEHEDRQAAWRLVTANLRLVVMIAREYQRAFHNLLDLVQEGNVGLLEAVKNFDPYRGIRFPSYAVWWIRAYIIRYIMNNWRLVKVGTTQAQR
ncbi:MAG TPA: sigma-70 family RNA polymerase sigma factor, partial [Candidatus Elarobacter sp.]|nr:sigma-70 family RNA polymerase sigma factor [Candidatus Elarobacter sp.]